MPCSLPALGRAIGGPSELAPQMKVPSHTGQLRLRGLEKARDKGALHAFCRNLRKFAKVTNMAPLQARGPLWSPERPGAVIDP